MENEKDGHDVTDHSKRWNAKSICRRLCGNKRSNDGSDHHESERDGNRGTLATETVQHCSCSGGCVA